MGEAAEDDAIEGRVCQVCGQFLAGSAPGFPRTCGECGGDAELFDGDVDGTPDYDLDVDDDGPFVPEADGEL